MVRRTSSFLVIPRREPLLPPRDHLFIDEFGRAVVRRSPSAGILRAGTTTPLASQPPLATRCPSARAPPPHPPPDRLHTPARLARRSAGHRHRACHDRARNCFDVYMMPPRPPVRCCCEPRSARATRSMCPRPARRAGGRAGGGAATVPRDRGRRGARIDATRRALQIDAIATKRFDAQTGADREVQRILLELLNQMDGFDQATHTHIHTHTHAIVLLTL